MALAGGEKLICVAVSTESSSIADERTHGQNRKNPDISPGLISAPGQMPLPDNSPSFYMA